MQPITTIESRTVVMPTSDIDTDQIIPARFLTTTSRDGLGEFLFNDLRRNADGTDNPEFALNKPEAKGCEILISGNNFGCGSSREHAPWALLDYGFKAVISTEIADIFRNNSLKNGLVPIIVDKATHEKLLRHSGQRVAIDIEGKSIRLEDGTIVHFPIDGFARYCLLKGIDQLGYLQEQMPQIEAFEELRTWTP